MTDIQSAAAEIRRGKKKRKKIEITGQKYNGLPYYIGRPELKCGPMPNVMAALPNIGGALCSTPQSLADAHY